MGAPYYIITIGGQSNSHAGEAKDPAIDVTNPRIWQQRQDTGVIEIADEPLVKLSVPGGYNKIGPMMAFARDYFLPRILPPTHDILLVHSALGGTTYSGGNWNVGDADYEAWVTACQTAMATHADNVMAVILQQLGEGDGAANMSQADYSAAEVSTFADFRARVPTAARCPIIVGGMPPQYVASNANTQHVRNAQQAIGSVVANAAYADPTGLVCWTGDPQFPLHYDAPSMRIMGRERYPAALQTLRWPMRLSAS